MSTTAGPRVTKFASDSNSVLQCCIAYNRYGGYCVPLSSRHRPAAQRILAGDIWEPRTLDFVQSQSAGGDIVHAGTFFGDFLPALSSFAAEGAKIWAFEPNVEIYRCALITVHINALPNVILISAGLGEHRNVLGMVTKDPAGKCLGGASRIYEGGKGRDESEGHSTPVTIVTVDEVLPTHRKVSIIQLDVEGHEKPALKGALSTIRRCKPTLILETMPARSWLEANILQLGYRIAENVHSNTVLRPE